MKTSSFNKVSLVRELEAELSRYKGYVLVQSFDAEAARLFKEDCLDILVGVICSGETDLNHVLELNWVDFVGVPLDVAKTSVSDEIRESGKESLGWTVRSNEDAFVLRAAGIDCFVFEGFRP